MKTSLVDKTPVAMVTLRRPLRDKINTGNVKLVPPGGLRYEHDKRSAWKSRCPLKFDMVTLVAQGAKQEFILHIAT